MTTTMPENITLTCYLDNFAQSQICDEPSMSGDNLGWVTVNRAWLTKNAMELFSEPLDVALEDYTADTTDQLIHEAARAGKLVGFGWGIRETED